MLFKCEIDHFPIRQLVPLLVHLTWLVTSISFNEAALLFDVSDKLPLERCREYHLRFQQLHQVFIHVSPADIQTLNALLYHVAIDDGDTRGKTFTALEDHAGRQSLTIECIQGVHGELEARDIELLESQLC